MPAKAGSRPARAAVLAFAVAAAALLAGCAAAAPSASAPSSPSAAAAATSSLGTSLAAANGTAWAIVPMGGPASQNDNFWELFARPAASSPWQLVTPPGVADNGGLVAAAPAVGSRLDIAFRPSQDLTFSPLALTGDAGRTWDTGLLDASVADVPDALATDGGTTLALLADGAVDEEAAPAAGWTVLAAPGAIAASAAGGRCGVTSLVAVSLTSAGTPLAAASCSRPGIAGIFARTSGGWQADGPALSESLAKTPIQVLQLTETSAGTVALLQAGGSSGALIAAWSGKGGRWTVSAPLPVGAYSHVSASGTANEGAVWVLLADGRAAADPGPGATWEVLPRVPSGTAVLAAGSGDAFDALAVSGSKLTVFQSTSAGTWRDTQTVSVPIQYGSSG